VRQTERSL